MKLKHALLWTFCVLTLLPETFAQSGLSIGCSGAYLQSFRKLKADESTSINKKIDSRNNLESPLDAIQFSIDGIYQYKNNLNLSFGIGYSNIGYQYKNIGTTMGYYYHPNRGWNVLIPNLDDIDIKYRLLRISIPIMIGYKLPLGSGSNHSLLFRLGFNNHVIVNTTYTAVYKFNDGTKEKERDDELRGDFPFPYNLSACANIGYYYKMNRHSIGVNLIGDYGLNSTNSDYDGIIEHPYYYGVGLSYLFSFN